jgi:ADP-heptose:LPS heptosyltransferase
MKKRHPHKTNILLVNITRLGDMIQATPTIAGLKAENPGGKVTVLVEKQFEEICRIIPGVDEVVSLDLGMTVRCLAREGEGIVDAYEYVTSVVEDLRKKNFDYCLNMSSSGYTALLLKLIGIEKNGGWTSDEEGYRIIESEWARLFATSVFHQNREYNSLNLVDIFRCSADVDQHPKHLVVDVRPDALEYADKLIAGAGFTNTGPLIAVQAGASQTKRQWLPEKFIKHVNVLVKEHNARVLLTGTSKELGIIEPIAQGCNSPNVFVAAGKTSIPQLGALLKRCNVLVTGDTGTMHLSVAVGTPVVAMFLASAFGFETGPYSEGNIVLQPVIACGPCNPNKPCARPDCHDTIDPEALARLAVLRAKRDIRELPQDMFDPRQVTVYRSTFDSFGFLDFIPLNAEPRDSFVTFRSAYRKLWLEELGGFAVPAAAAPKNGSLKIAAPELEYLPAVKACAEEGKKLIAKLIELVKDHTAPAKALGEVNAKLSEIDRQIESIGFQVAPLGPLTRMFVFAKENISGPGPIELASQMGTAYEDLVRRAVKLGQYYQEVA